jgi:amino acid efflux transporter
MLGLAGQNFVILFGVAAASLFVLAKSRFDRFLAASVALLVLALMVLQGETLLYPIALVASLIIRYSIRALVRRKASTSES